MDDFTITPAMLAYLAAFDAWLLEPSELSLARRRRALRDLTGIRRTEPSGPVRFCRSGQHVLDPGNLYGQSCRACHLQRCRERYARRKKAAA